MTKHDFYMRKAFDLAISALERGNHPFGAVLVRGGEVILTAENTVNTDKDPTRHAELNLVVKAYGTYPREVLGECTLYASTAPCPMCAYAMWEGGIRKIVYGVTYETFTKLITHGSPYIPCEELYKRLRTPARIRGGVLEDEGTDVYRNWTK